MQFLNLLTCICKIKQLCLTGLIKYRAFVQVQEMFLLRNCHDH